MEQGSEQASEKKTNNNSSISKRTIGVWRPARGERRWMMKKKNKTYFYLMFALNFQTSNETQHCGEGEGEKKKRFRDSLRAAPIEELALYRAPDNLPKSSSAQRTKKERRVKLRRSKKKMKKDCLLMVLKHRAAWFLK